MQLVAVDYQAENAQEEFVKSLTCTTKVNKTDFSLRAYLR